jgi:hypothetical protein
MPKIIDEHFLHLPVYLIGGSGSHEGDVVALNATADTWGPVCYNNWSFKNVNFIDFSIVFRQMLYARTQSNKKLQLRKLQKGLE